MKFSKKIKIGNFNISDDSPVFIIAEAGVNHDGDVSKAKRLIDVASAAGADAVKFQAFRAESLILKNVKKARYQSRTTSSGESQFEMLRRLELGREENSELLEHCKKKKIIFLTTPFDDVSLDEIDFMDLPAYKIASTDLTNLPYLKKVAKKGRPIILSTGMSYLNEIELALNEIRVLNKDVILMQCTASYPADLSDSNLKLIQIMKNRFDIITGFSDHTIGFGAAPYAVAAGAKVIEKHFTLDKRSPGPDHRASLSPIELKGLIKEIRRVELIMGSAVKKPGEAEKETRRALQKCLVAARDIDKHELFSASNIVAKRTGGFGISPVAYKTVFGKAAKKVFLKDEIITI